MSDTIEKSEIEGRWITPSVNYVDPQRIACALCGPPIPRRYWRAEVGGENRTFCEPAHAGLYETYWIPTYQKPEN